MKKITSNNTYKIMSMEPEKRERIINAALSEFCKGYKQASTDAIVRKAGISKGLLFHYFATKKELLTFLFDYATNKLATDLVGRIDFDEPDLLERLWKMTTLKMEMIFQYPAIFDFIVAIFLGKESEFSELQKQVTNSFQLSWDQIFNQIDYSLFKTNIDPPTAIEVIRHTFSGYSDTIIERFKAQDETLQMNESEAYFNEVLEQTKKYMDFFRKTFYK